MAFNFGDLGKIGALMKNMKGMQAAMEQAKAELDHVEVEAESGAGDVKVRMTASQRMLSIEIADHLLSVDNKSVLQDLIVGATQLATEQAKAAAQEKMRAISGNMGMPLPEGMDDIL
jgi:DNA-binding YbaB/EbfC family protein